MFIPDPKGSIPDTRSEFFLPGSQIRIFPSRIRVQKDTGSLIRIFFPSRIRIQGSKGTGRNPRMRRKTEFYARRHIDLDEEMLEGDGLVCVVIHVGVPEVGEYSQLSRHCLKKNQRNQSISYKESCKNCEKRELCGGCRTVFFFNCIGLHIV
jgi:hypothetical protein